MLGNICGTDGLGNQMDGPFLRPVGPSYPSSLKATLNVYHEYQVPSLDQGPHLLRMAGMTESGSITGLCEEALWLQKEVHDTYYLEAPQCQLR